MFINSLYNFRRHTIVRLAIEIHSGWNPRSEKVLKCTLLWAPRTAALNANKLSIVSKLYTYSILPMAEIAHREPNTPHSIQVMPSLLISGV